MILEDEGARMALAGDALPVQNLVTGACECCFPATFTTYCDTTATFSATGRNSKVLQHSLAMR